MKYSDVRAIGGEHGQVGELEQLVAALGLIRKYLQRQDLENGAPNPFMAHYQQWLYAVVSYPNGWKGGYEANAGMSDAALTSLQTLAWIMDARGVDAAASAQLSDAQALNDLLAEVERLMVADQTIPPKLAGFISQLVATIRAELGGSASGLPFDLDKAVTRLLVFLEALGDISTDEQEMGKYGAAAEKFIYDASVSGAGGVFTEVIKGVGRGVIFAITNGEVPPM